MKNVLITSAGKRVVLVEIFKKTIEGIGAGGAVFTTDVNPSFSPAAIISDKSFRVPHCKDGNYLTVLLDLCRKNDVGIIIPTIDTELKILSESRELFRAYSIEVIVSDLVFINVCRDKRKTESYLANLGIPCPKAIDKNNPVFPIFAKPYDGSLSANLHVIKKEEDLTKEILDDPKLIFMEYIDKNEYKEFTVDMYYGKDNRVKSIVPRERIEIRAGEINKGITRKNYIVEYLKERMGELRGVRGCICIQLFYRESDNDIKGIEINPRFGGGYPLSYYAKANYADFIIKEYLLGETIDYSDGWLDNTLMLRYDNDVIVYDAEA